MLNYPSPNPVILAHQRRQIAAEIIVGVLAVAGLEVEINPGGLRVGRRQLYFDTDIRRKLSEAIYGSIFPRQVAGEFFHYTRLEPFANIARTGDLWLYSLRKRMGNPYEGEFFTFARLQGWRGFEDEAPSERERPGSDLFYTSLTSIDAVSEAMWDMFGPIRLRMRIGTTRRMAQIRAVQYHDLNQETLLQTINRALEVEGFPPVLPESSYRMSAYSLPGWLRNETEIRLMHMHLRGQQDVRRTDGEWDYWPVPIGVSNDIADVSLVGIEAGPRADLAKICEIAQAASAFAGIAPTRAP